MTDHEYFMELNRSNDYAMRAEAMTHPARDPSDPPTQEELYELTHATDPHLYDHPRDCNCPACDGSGDLLPDKKEDTTWYCDACKKNHKASVTRHVLSDGRNLCSKALDNLRRNIFRPLRHKSK